MQKTKILVVDDEESLCEILKYNLNTEGFEVDVAYSAESALNLNLSSYSLILLDVMMGQISGLEMLLRLRSNPATASIPVILCTAKNTEDDKVVGLNIGADDYITKPFSIREVMARVKSLLRRTQPSVVEEDEQLTFQTMVLNLRDKTCHIDGEEVTLTKKEFEILVLLLSNKGQILSRENILQKVWEDDVVVLGRTIDVNITRMRKKLKQYGKNIITRQGYGYGFKE
jgi:Response regulators consisting of a CheY-like receiver domain and a winged-helix DNA-binding domain